MSTTTTIPAFDVKAAITDALEQTPPRQHLRVWIEQNPLSLRVSLDGGLKPGSINERKHGDDAEQTFVQWAGGTYHARGVRFPPHTTGQTLLTIYVAAHVHHGWTLHERTETEARLWRPACPPLIRSHERRSDEH